MTTPACHSFAGMAANRFLLGLLEATVNPGFVLIMSMWYTSAEQPLRLGAYYCTNGIATMCKHFPSLMSIAMLTDHSWRPHRLCSRPHQDWLAALDVRLLDLWIC